MLPIPRNNLVFIRPHIINPGFSTSFLRGLSCLHLNQDDEKSYRIYLIRAKEIRADCFDADRELWKKHRLLPTFSPTDYDEVLANQSNAFYIQTLSRFASNFYEDLEEWSGSVLVMRQQDLHAFPTALFLTLRMTRISVPPKGKYTLGWPLILPDSIDTVPRYPTKNFFHYEAEQLKKMMREVDTTAYDEKWAWANTEPCIYIKNKKSSYLE